jgi:hypothetical protein
VIGENVEIVGGDTQKHNVTGMKCSKTLDEGCWRQCWYLITWCYDIERGMVRN